METGTAPAAVRAVEAVWRIESARLVAGLARFTGDLGRAEELAQDALVVALDHWPRTGVPPNPAGWLMTTAKNRAIDGYRRDEVHRIAVERIGRDAAAGAGIGSANDIADIADSVADAVDDPIGDDWLRLVFTAAHPAVPLDARVAMCLRCLAGLSTDEIARGFLLSPAQVGQRISRAKKTLRDRGIRFDLPAAAELDQRLGPVLQVIYLVFNEGHTASSGADLLRPDLTLEALRWGRTLATLMPDAAEAHGLLALMELTAARAPARVAADGSVVLLGDQDRSRWDRLLLRRGLDGLEAAQAAASRTGRPVGPYTVQAAIAACHATASSVADTDWRRIVELYDVLLGIWPSPVVALNRAVAIAEASGPAAGLAALDALVQFPPRRRTRRLPTPACRARGPVGPHR